MSNNRGGSKRAPSSRRPGTPKAPEQKRTPTPVNLTLQSPHGASPSAVRKASPRPPPIPSKPPWLKPRPPPGWQAGTPRRLNLAITAGAPNTQQSARPPFGAKPPWLTDHRSFSVGRSSAQVVPRAPPAAHLLPALENTAPTLQPGQNSRQQLRPLSSQQSPAISPSWNHPHSTVVRRDPGNTSTQAGAAGASSGPTYRLRPQPPRPSAPDGLDHIRCGEGAAELVFHDVNRSYASPNHVPAFQDVLKHSYVQKEIKVIQGRGSDAVKFYIMGIKRWLESLTLTPDGSITQKVKARL